jgi:hypothetical protein
MKLHELRDNEGAVRKNRNNTVFVPFVAHRGIVPVKEKRHEIT